MATMTRAIGYHGSASENLALTIDRRRTLCVADDKNIAGMYRRGDDCWLYTFSWDCAEVSVADEATAVETLEKITGGGN